MNNWYHDINPGELGYFMYVFDTVNDLLELGEALRGIEGFEGAIYAGELGEAVLGSELIELHELERLRQATASEVDVWDNVELDELKALERWLWERG